SAVAAAALALPKLLRAQVALELPIVRNVPLQPLVAQVKRVVAAMDFLGAPLSAADKAALESAFALGDARAADAGERIQRVLDASCLVGVNINPQSRVKVLRGSAPAELVEQGWRQFLVKVHNEAGVTAPLRGTSVQALPLHGSPANEVDDRWLDLMMFDAQPLTDSLSGLVLDYRIIQLY